MEHQQNQSTNALSKPSSGLLLRENANARREIDALLLACATSQKLYGREPEAFEASVQVIQRVLSGYPAEKAEKAVLTWLERSAEFPTPADLVGLIKRNGKPPLRESDIIAIRKKEGADRTREEWDALKEWDAQQSEGWGGADDQAKLDATLADNIRLRNEIMGLRDEVRRLSDLLKAREAVSLEQAPAAPPPRPVPSLKERIDAVVSSMRLFGASEEEVAQFINQAEEEKAA